MLAAASTAGESAGGDCDRRRLRRCPGAALPDLLAVELLPPLPASPSEPLSWLASSDSSSEEPRDRVALGVTAPRGVIKARGEAAAPTAAVATSGAVDASASEAWAPPGLGDHKRATEPATCPRARPSAPTELPPSIASRCLRAAAAVSAAPLCTPTEAGTDEGAPCSSGDCAAPMSPPRLALAQCLARFAGDL